MHSAIEDRGLVKGHAAPNPDCFSKAGEIWLQWGYLHEFGPYTVCPSDVMWEIMGLPISYVVHIVHSGEYSKQSFQLCPFLPLQSIYSKELLTGVQRGQCQIPGNLH